LHRIPDQAVFGGVCAGIAQYLQIDVVIVRVVFVVMALPILPPGFGMTGLLYIILWAVLPTGPAGEVYTTNTVFGSDPSKPSDPVSDKKRSDQTMMILGGVLIFFGGLMLVDDLPFWWSFKKVLLAHRSDRSGRVPDPAPTRQRGRNKSTVYPTTPPPVDPVDPGPDPEPYTPFSPSSSPESNFPEDPELKKPDNGDDDVIKVN
jgi:phage shock protein C